MTRYAKADAERFNGKPRINKLKDANLATAGEHEAWARDFAQRFTDALPSYGSEDEGSARHWLVGVKIVDGAKGLKFLRLKVWNGAKGPDIYAKGEEGKGDVLVEKGDTRRHLFIPLGSDANPVALAVVTAAGMATQPHKRAVVGGAVRVNV